MIAFLKQLFGFTPAKPTVYTDVDKEWDEQTDQDTAKSLDLDEALTQYFLDRRKKVHGDDNLNAADFFKEQNKRDELK